MQPKIYFPWKSGSVKGSSRVNSLRSEYIFKTDTLTVGSRELVTFQFFVNELRRLRTIMWVKHENAHEICLPRALAYFSRFTVLILGLLSVYNYLQILSTQQAKTQPKKPSLRSNKHMKTKQVFWKHAGSQSFGSCAANTVHRYETGPYYPSD